MYCHVYQTAVRPPTCLFRVLNTVKVTSSALTPQRHVVAKQDDAQCTHNIYKPHGAGAHVPCVSTSVTLPQVYGAASAPLPVNTWTLSKR